MCARWRGTETRQTNVGNAVGGLGDLEFAGCLPPVTAPAGDHGAENRARKLEGVDEILIDVTDVLRESNPFGIDHKAESAVFAFDFGDHIVVADQFSEGFRDGSAPGTERGNAITVESCGGHATGVGQVTNVDRSRPRATPQFRPIVDGEN